MGVFVDNRPLLEAFRRGESDALATVYRQYVDDVALVLRRGFVLEGGTRVPGVGAEEGRDCVQEVFCRAFAPTARASYDGLRPYRPFILRIAKNLLIDRARKGTQEVLEDAGLEEPVLLELDLDVDTRALRAATQSYVAQLDPEVRELVRLRFDEEQSQIEVAAALALSRRRVRTLESALLRGLKQELRRLKLLGR